MPWETYRAWPAINASLLHGYARSPLHARHEQLHPRDSGAMALGRALHAALLEPDLFLSRYVPRFRHAGKGMRERNRDHQVELLRRGLVELDEQEFAQVSGMRSAVLEHPLAGQLVREAFAREVSALWIDEEKGVPCKARFDLMVENHRDVLCVPDLKTCRDARPRAFQRDVVDYGYHVAAAWYLDGLAQLQPGRDRGWCWIAVESSAPHDVVVYEPDEYLLRRGWEESRRLLALHLEAEREQRWRGYSDEAVPMSAPGWL